MQQFPQRANIILDDSGIRTTALSSDGFPISEFMSWSEVRRITVFKRDCFTVDLVCMAIETTASQVEVNEEMDGWEALLASLPKGLPGVLPEAEWWQEVVRHPFATTYRWKAELAELAGLAELENPRKSVGLRRQIRAGKRVE